MQVTKLSEHLLFQKILQQNSNTSGYKEVVAKTVKAIQQRTYWYFTSNEAQFLAHVYDKQLDREVLKRRIGQITEEKLNQVFAEIITGSLTNINDKEEGELQVQLGVQCFYDELPAEDERTQRGKQKIKQINQQFKAFKQKMQEKKRRQEQKKTQKLALQQEFRKSLQHEKRQQQRQQILKKIQSLKKKEQQRKQSNQKYKVFIQEFKKAKPLHVMMQQLYKQKIQLPALEQSRRKLQSLTHRKKPTLEEINDHDRVYMEKKSNRLEKSVFQSQTIDVSFKSHFYQLQEEKLREKEDYQQNGPQWDFLEKQKRYSQFVKEKVKPKISAKLKKSLEDNLSNSNMYKEVPDRAKIIQVGKNYLQYMRNLEKKRKNATPNEAEGSIKESRYRNYLEQLKSRSEQTHTGSMDWERDMRDRASSKMQRRQRVLMKSKQLEQKAMRDQKFISHYNYGRADQIIAKKKQIDDTLLSSIKAKVAVLKDARQP